MSHACLLEIARICTQLGLSVSVAESCTGGMVACAFTSISGASLWFKGGVIAYSNEIKKNVLGINAETLDKYGAISQETAIEMALCVRRLMSSDLSLSVTGLAGPGSDGISPAGTVYIGICDKKGVTYKRFLFNGTREEIRRQSCEAAIDSLLERITI